MMQRAGWVLWLLLATGCAADPEPSEPSSAEQAAEARAQEQAVEANRVAAAERVLALPAVGAAEVSVGRGIGGTGAANVEVTVVREDGEPVDDALAQRVVERVVEVFQGVSPNNVAVRDGARGDYLYIGDIGRIE